MERYIKSVLRPYIELFAVGFSTDQLSLSLLSGKGVIEDLEVNVDAVNDKLEELDPSIPFRIRRIYVSRCHVVASVRKIKSRPLRLKLDTVIVDVEEPPVMLPPRQGLTRGAPSKSKYGLGDRIGAPPVILPHTSPHTPQTLHLTRLPAVNVR